MKSWGNGIEELMINGWLTLIIMTGVIILGDWFYYIPDEINEPSIIILFSILDVSGLIGIIVYTNKTDQSKQGTTKLIKSENQ